MAIEGAEPVVEATPSAEVAPIVETPAAAETLASEPAESPEVEVNEFAELSDDFIADDNEGSEPEPAPAEEPAVAPVDGEKPAAEEAKPEASAEPGEVGKTEGEKPVVAEVVTEPVVEPVVEAKPEVQPTPEAVAASQAEYVKQLETHFQVPQELVEELQTSPELALPKLQARMYSDIMASMQRAINKQIPAMIEQHAVGKASATAGEDAFYGAWPQLKEHGTEVSRIATMYRGMYPKATQEDFIRDVGGQAMMSLKLSPQAQVVAPVVETVVDKPAGGLGLSGSVPAAGAPSQSDNEFTIISQEFSEYDAT